MAYDPEYDDLQEDEMLEDELPPPEAGWTDALQAQFGSVPWWVISAVVHVVLLLLLSLIFVSAPMPETSDTIMPMELV